MQNVCLWLCYLETSEGMGWYDTWCSKTNRNKLFFCGSGEDFKSPTSAGFNNHRQHIYLRIRSQFRFCITMNEGQSQTKTD